MPNFNAIGPAVTEQQAENFGHPTGGTRHVPQWVLVWFGIGPIHGRRNGGTHHRRPLVNRAFGSRDIPKPLKSVTTAGGPAAHTQDFPLFSVELARPSASLVIS